MASGSLPLAGGAAGAGEEPARHPEPEALA
jgi:hypothetical protein